MSSFENADKNAKEMTSIAKRLDWRAFQKILAVGGTLLIADVQAEVQQLGRTEETKAERSISNPDYSGLRYEVSLPPEARRDFAAVVQFALDANAALAISPDDLYHCHVLITEKTLNEKYAPGVYEGKLSEFIDAVLEDYAGFICHTQENKGRMGAWSADRNVVILRGQQPFVASPDPSSSTGLADLEKLSNTDQALTSPFPLYFKIDPNGEVKLRGGTRLKVVLEFAEQLLKRGKISDDLSR